MVNGDAFSEQDHPRRCGENGLINEIDSSKRGSPPQVRGKRVFQPCLHHAFGITPAGAGKT